MITIANTTANKPASTNTNNLFGTIENHSVVAVEHVEKSTNKQAVRPATPAAPATPVSLGTGRWFEDEDDDEEFDPEEFSKTIASLPNPASCTTPTSVRMQTISPTVVKFVNPNTASPIKAAIGKVGPINADPDVDAGADSDAVANADLDETIVWQTANGKKARSAKQSKAARKNKASSAVAAPSKNMSTTATASTTASASTKTTTASSGSSQPRSSRWIPEPSKPITALFGIPLGRLMDQTGWTTVLDDDKNIKGATKKFTTVATEMALNKLRTTLTCETMWFYIMLGDFSMYVANDNSDDGYDVMVVIYLATPDQQQLIRFAFNWSDSSQTGLVPLAIGFPMFMSGPTPYNLYWHSSRKSSLKDALLSMNDINTNTVKNLPLLTRDDASPITKMPTLLIQGKQLQDFVRMMMSGSIAVCWDTSKKILHQHHGNGVLICVGVGRTEPASITVPRSTTTTVTPAYTTAPTTAHIIAKPAFDASSFPTLAESVVLGGSPTPISAPVRSAWKTVPIVPTATAGAAITAPIKPASIANAPITVGSASVANAHTRQSRIQAKLESIQADLKNQQAIVELTQADMVRAKLIYDQAQQHLNQLQSIEQSLMESIRRRKIDELASKAAENGCMLVSASYKEELEEQIRARVTAELRQESERKKHVLSESDN